MSNLPDILTYAAFLGFEFAAVCMMTRSGRGWPWRIGGLLALVAVDVALERWWQTGKMLLHEWLAICFIANWATITVLINVLSRDSLGRRTFLSLIYGAYAIGFSVIFHLVAYRNVFGLPEIAAGLSGFGAVLGLNLLLFLWILPSMPPDSPHCRWGIPCVSAGVVALSMYACGVWPISVLTAPFRYCSAFAFASAVAWVVFPLLCRTMRDRLHNADVEQHLTELTAEMKVRRAAIDAARRLRHDQRHHRVQLAEYLLRGECEQALAYLRELDVEAEETPMNRMVWCQNETVNAILSGAARKAAAKGVAFHAEVHDECPIELPDIEQVALLANLVENAIDACGEVKGEGQGQQRNCSTCSAVGSRACGKTPLSTLTSSLDLPGVRIAIRSRAHGIGITVSNPVPAGFALAANGLPTATPGVGLESVRRVVVRHHADWSYELADGVLTCRVILMFRGRTGGEGE